MVGRLNGLEGIGNPELAPHPSHASLIGTNSHRVQSQIVSNVHCFRAWEGLIIACSLSGFLSTTDWGDEFQELSDSFGTTLTLAGAHHPTTINPDGTAINFWTPESEGAAANTVGLSNPQMVAAHAYGNIYIADKASHAILRITADGLIHTFAGMHVAGCNGDGPAPATDLHLNHPNGLFVFPGGVDLGVSPAD